VVICLLAGAYSLTAPWLAANRVQDAESANLAGNPAAAASAARDAAQLDPFSVDPITQLALAYASARDIPDALRQYRRATRLQPENADTWFSLGQYAYCIGRYHDAYVALNQAYTLDRYGPAGIRGGYLDRARAKVNAGVNLVPPSRAGCSS
jgi:cytochrome c-type biogenesis protein CcmH/NrfG